MLQGHRRPILDCWPRSRRAITGYLARIDQALILNSTARVAANNGKGKGFWAQDRETAQVVRRSGQGVQDKTERDQSDLQGRSARFILAKRLTDLAYIAHFQQDRTDPKARSTQDFYLLSEDFRTAKTPISKTNQDRCDPRSRSQNPRSWCEDFRTRSELSTQTLSEIDISQGHYEELKPAQPTGTQGEHKVIQQGTDRSTPSVSRQVWASGRSTFTQAIL